MNQFAGFPQKGRLIKIPALFFSELLPQIDNLNELRVILYCFWRLDYIDRDRQYLWEGEIAADEAFIAGLGETRDQQESALQDGLKRAVTRGALLEAVVQKSKRLFFINGMRGQAMAEGAASGQWNPKDGLKALLSLSLVRPNIFTLYERNIGPLTPLIREKLKDMEKDYPALWIEEAVGISVEQNKRSIAYIEAILKRWKQDGKGDDINQSDASRFISEKLRGKVKY